MREQPEVGTAVRDSRFVAGFTAIALTLRTVRYRKALEQQPETAEG